MRIVVAVGGNALLPDGGSGSWEEQIEMAHTVAGQLIALRDAGHQIVLTHGNGPQVGMLLLQQSLGAAEAPILPLDAAIAMTQGQIGYLLETALTDLDPSMHVTTVLSRVVVDPNTLTPPTKPVGPFYTEAHAQELAAERGWDVIEDSNRGWRRVVGSPKPIKVLGCDRIRTLMETGAIVIAGGGGGIPVTPDADGNLIGVQGVIDKDRCSTELAIALEADLFVLVTGVRHVATDFGTRWERHYARMTVSDALRGLADGEFPAGSMGPKIESAARFIDVGGGEAIISSIDHVADAVLREDGTRLVADHDGPSTMCNEPVLAEAA